MSSKKIVVFFILGAFLHGFSQDCNFRLSGFVKDLSTGLPLQDVNIYLEENKRATLSNANGFFQMDAICKGSYHLVFSHIGCKSKRIFLDMGRNTVLSIKLQHHVISLNNMVVKGNLTPITARRIEKMNRKTILQNSNENLSNMLASLVGVTVLNNGNGIAKPVVNGLYGNRLTLINSGVPQSGQRWGNDHAPEIDPLVAGTIKVVKGTGAIEYMGSHLGSVIVVEPERIRKSSLLQGGVHYFFESNGLGNGLSLQLQQYGSKLAWKVTSTLKKKGDKKTRDYFLKNTGSTEMNLALQLEKTILENWFIDVYASTFNTELGVLRGSHIGNIRDLNQALKRKVPFFTESTFNYSIEAPKQKVNHHLMKIKSKYLMNDSQQMEVTLAGQFNYRKEFDVRRGGRTQVAALDLKQHSFFIEAKHRKKLQPGLNIRSGIQWNLTNNTNGFGTGVFPLIPDYLSYELGFYTTVSKKNNKWLFEWAMRYDKIFQKIGTITNTIPRKIVKYDNDFNNFRFSKGVVYEVNKALSLHCNLGYVMRNPAVNELYSRGLHQGVAGIEEGNIHLKTEKSIKSIFGCNIKMANKSWIKSSIYYQNISDYIFLNPQEEMRLTIRGAFPVFRYEQTHAHMYGWDISSGINIAQYFYIHLTYSYLRGYHTSDRVPLIGLPSDRIYTAIGHQFKPIQFGKKQLKNTTIALHNQYVFEQTHLLAHQDFVLPPKDYNLLGIKASTDLQWSKIKLTSTAKVENLLNVSYRDYLNRQRYFADDMGINIIFGINLEF